MSEYVANVGEFVGVSGKTIRFPEYIDLSQEIVRCRDCEYFAYADSKHGNNDWCAKHEHIAWSVNGYCAWGVRKEGGE